MTMLCSFIKWNRRPVWFIDWLNTPELINLDAKGHFRRLLNLFELENQSRLAIHFGGNRFKCSVLK